MDTLCLRIGVFCGNHRDTRKMRNTPQRFGHGYRGAHGYSAAFFVAYGFNKRSGGKITSLGGKTRVFLILSGLATGASWLCYYTALRDGPAAAVAPIDKLSIAVSVVFSYVVFGEKLSAKAFFGLLIFILGTMLMLL